MSFKKVWKNNKNLFIILIIAIFIIGILAVIEKSTNVKISINKLINYDEKIVSENKEDKIKIKMIVDENNNVIINKDAITTLTIINDNSYDLNNNISVSFKWFNDSNEEVSSATYNNWSCKKNSTEKINLNLSNYIADDCSLKINIKVANDSVENNKNDTSSNNSNVSTNNYYSNNSSNTSSNKKISDRDIWVYTQYVVKQHLKSPKSADFPSINNATITRRSDSIIVQSYVDAENSFGANIRSNFTVVLSADAQKALSVSIE